MIYQIPSGSLAIAYVQLVRSYRKLRTRPQLAALYLLPIIIIVPGVVGRIPVPGYESFWAAPGAYVYGTMLSSGDHATVLETGRGISGALFVLVTYFVVLPGTGMGDDVDGLLLAVQPRTIAIAELVTYVMFSARLVGVIVLAGAIAFGAGAGTLLVSAWILFVALLLFVTAVAIAYPLVLATTLAFVRVAPIRDNKLLVGGPLVLGVFAMFLRFRDALELLSTLPIGWYADLALLPTSATVSTSRAAAIALAAPLVVTVSAVVVARISEQVWLADAPEHTSTSSENDSMIAGLLNRLVSRPVAAVACTTWRRILREPRTLLFVGLLIVVSTAAVLTIADQRPDGIPIIVAIYGAATVSVGVTLNPLGNEGRALPAVLTAPNGGRTLLVGYALSAALPGGLLVGLATATASSATTLDVGTQLALTLVGVVLGVCAPIISIGFGVALPNFTGIELSRNSRMHPPRLLAAILLSILVVVIGLPAIFGVYDNDLLAETPLPTALVTASGIGITVFAAVVASWFSFRYALRVVEEFEI